MCGVEKNRPLCFHPSLLSRRSPNPRPSPSSTEPPFKKRLARQPNRSIHYHPGGRGGGGEKKRDASLHVPRTCTPTFEPVAYFGNPPRVCATSKKRIMATLNKLATACWRSSRGLERRNVCNGLMLTAVRLLHKSAASETFGIAAAGEEAAAEPLIAAAAGGESSTAKSLKEMPGPSTLSNLVEFFWRDGFSRIHEIQVRMNARRYRCRCCCSLRDVSLEKSAVNSPPHPPDLTELQPVRCVKAHRRTFSGHGSALVSKV